jgi:hypothetical protein
MEIQKPQPSVAYYVNYFNAMGCMGERAGYSEDGLSVQSCNYVHGLSWAAQFLHAP